MSFFEICGEVAEKSDDNCPNRPAIGRAHLIVNKDYYRLLSVENNVT
jgi:hypothetical protein